MADPDNARPDLGIASPDGTVPGDTGPDGTSPSGAGPTDRPDRRDYEAVGQAARQLGGRGDLPGVAGVAVHPVEESEQVAAAVDDEAPVPELAQPQFGGPAMPEQTGQQDSQDTQEIQEPQEARPGLAQDT